MYKIVFIRHGESIWNKENRFTGWIDVDLSDKGNVESKEAGILLKILNFKFDLIYTSVLKRAIQTLIHIKNQMDIANIPVKYSWRLNERHYGLLSGLNKEDVRRKHGDKQLLIWRRSYTVSPPKLNFDDHLILYKNEFYKKTKKIPLCESLKDTLDRTLPIWNMSIVPSILSNKKILIVAHGNSIRAILKYLDSISDKDIINLNIPNAVPIVYELDKKMKPINSYFLDNDYLIKNNI